MYYEREGLNGSLHWQKYDQTYAQKGPNEQHRPLYLQIEGNPGSTLRITDLYEYNIPKTHIKKKKDSIIRSNQGTMFMQHIPEF